MIQIFTMQLRQILSGRKKWFVILLLAMPVLLTYATMSFGGLGELRQEIARAQAERANPGAPTPMTRGSQRRLVVTGEPMVFAGGQIKVTRDGIFYNGGRLSPQLLVNVDHGYLVIENGQVWIDESRRPRHEGSSIDIRARGIDPDLARLGWDTIVAIYLFLLYPQVICLLLALFYGSSLLNSELENKTLTYLFTRPIARWRIVTGKYLAIVSALVPATAISLSVSWFLLGAPDPTGLLPGLLAGAIGGILAYNAVFVLLGFLAPKRAMVLALIYGVVFEFILSFVPALVNEATITYYLRSLVVGIVQLEVPQEIARIVGGASLTTSILALACTTTLALGISSLLASRREYPITDQ